MSQNKQKKIEAPSINHLEVENFTRIANEWWDPKGKFKPLHKFNPARLEYIITNICDNFKRDRTAYLPLKDIKILDIGCGGGLLSEPLSRLGAEVVGIDVAYKNIEVAKLHASQSGLKIDYRAMSLEDLASTEEKFDVVLNMEVIEHVENPRDFIHVTLSVVKVQGLVFIATLNRTLKSYVLAIIGAEYILGWLPKGTHDINKFIKPSELKAYFKGYNFSFIGETGVVYNPLYDKWSLGRDMAVNYMLVAKNNNL